MSRKTFASWRWAFDGNAPAGVEREADNDFFAITAPQRPATTSVPLLWLGRHYLERKCVVTTSCLRFCSSRVANDAREAIGIFGLRSQGERAVSHSISPRLVG